MTHGYSALVHNEFQGLTLHSQGLPDTDGLAAVPANIENGLSFAKDFAILLGILIGARMLTFWELLLIVRYNWL